MSTGQETRERSVVILSREDYATLRESLNGAAAAALQMSFHVPKQWMHLSDRLLKMVADARAALDRGTV